MLINTTKVGTNAGQATTKEKENQSKLILMCSVSKAKLTLHNHVGFSILREILKN